MKMLSNRWYMVMPWLLLTIATCPRAEQSDRTTANPPSELKRVSFKPWYRRLNTFLAFDLSRREMFAERQSLLNPGLKETFQGTSLSRSLALTLGGNLLPKTAVHLALTLDKQSLEGTHQGAEEQKIGYHRNKTLSELFIDYNIRRQMSLGVDFYFGGDIYRNNGEAQKLKDKEYGGGFSMSFDTRLFGDPLKASYIFSHRRVDVGSGDEGDSQKSFHSLLSTYSHQWSYRHSAEVNFRLSYYPSVNPFKYWESRYIWSLGGEWHYRTGDDAELTFNVERLAYGHSSVDTVSLNFRYYFGSESKRRKRMHRLPRLLIN